MGARGAVHGRCMIRTGSDNARHSPSLVPVPSEAEVRSFERFLAEWLAEAAERRLRRREAA